MAWATLIAENARIIVNRIEIDAIETNTNLKLLTRLKRYQFLIYTNIHIVTKRARVFGLELTS